ncbi:carbohydrate ABC transporter ATP-binding protein, CUT1 family (TC 3.A.1.1.-) [Cohaesibacter marisflavi]|uniref:Carbohydrate ABC transporter ATP-binding protein, CUT1 family (TC 3.A.1.1.-) n=2 Tax=Cohaesibacter marisflavi TaxID=655353 RepID=A0A1I5BX69_9HYPH|nr:sn-glycerol-3-phosphate ABC transporter ATP-binding protein UgpC [Cohaesibacter marisflavi]SFN79328.1 carbohydrate ABC transporter ATP-binding protein, CUT1 family (TC 3.A.1.1.-) [Cohaesibacter marisflavi]
MNEQVNLQRIQRQAGLCLRRVSKSFGSVEVIRDVDLDIEGGEFVVFVGPSGCGKSTLLRLIAGLEEVTSGDVLIAGKDVTEEDPSDRGIAMVFQTYALYPHMTVAQNMGFGLKVAGRSKTEVEEKVGQAADVLQLNDYLDRRPGQLSGGQRQRVAIGRAIVRDPDVFLFDEPLSNLDAELRVDMRIEIARLHQKLGNTMIYVTHDQTEAMTLADKIVVLRAGRIEQVGSPSTLYDDPDNMFVGGFIGSPKMNFMDGVMRQNGVEVAGVILQTRPITNRPADGTPVHVGIRPEHWRLAEEGKTAVPFKVGFSEFLGGASYLYGTIGEKSCTVNVEREAISERGSVLNLMADADHICLFDQNERRIR